MEAAAPHSSGLGRGLRVPPHSGQIVLTSFTHEMEGTTGVASQASPRVLGSLGSQASDSIPETLQNLPSLETGGPVARHLLGRADCRRARCLSEYPSGDSRKSRGMVSRVSVESSAQRRLLGGHQRQSVASRQSDLWRTQRATAVTTPAKCSKMRRNRASPGAFDPGDVCGAET